MTSNYFICRNEVIIEGINVGQFESFECKTNCRTLGNTAVLTLPLYALGSDGTFGRAKSRMRTVLITGTGEEAENLIKPCSQIEVWCWYDTWNDKTMQHESMEKVLVFAGFIEHVVEGFPAQLHLQDNSYILRFGEVQKGWDGKATLQDIVTDCIPIAEKGFKAEREARGLTREIPSLTYSVDKKNVQAITTSLSFRNWGARSPFDTIQKLMQLLVLYGGVSRDFNVFIGAGVEKNTRPLVPLDTRYNVVERDIVPIDGRFVDYDVKITGILANGKQYTATGGYGTTRSRQNRSEFEKSYGQTHRGFTTLNTVQGIQDFADAMLAMLRGNRNKGKIVCLLYPKIEIMDWVEFNETVFEQLASGYYVIDYQFRANESGYFQTLEVTDQVFAI